MPQRKHSVELKLLHGVDQNELVDLTPKPPRREPKRPPNLSVVELRLWSEVTAELRDMDMLSSADTEEIRAYVQTVALSYRLHDAVAKLASLVTVNPESGMVRTHPLIAAYDQSVGRAHTLAGALGLTPHGRSLIHGRTVEKANTEAANVKDLYA